jgi:hypothetical protein
MKKVSDIMVHKHNETKDDLSQLTRHALERSVELRTQYTINIATNYSSNQLVFVDESAADRRTTYRGHAWAFKGRRAVRKSFFVRGRW